jgi:hypothetical protein
VSDLRRADLDRIAAALNIQVERDLKPVWNVQATVEAFDSLDLAPKGASPIVIRKSLPPGEGGFHLVQDGVPYAAVAASDTVSVTISHELINMLTDPTGNRLTFGRSMDPAENGAQVGYLLEPADPVEAETFSYAIDGVQVSDFVFPAWFQADPTGAVKTRFDQTGMVHEPLKLLRGGYMSWINNATGVWRQALFFEGTQPIFHSLN